MDGRAVCVESCRVGRRWVASGLRAAVGERCLGARARSVVCLSSSAAALLEVPAKGDGRSDVKGARPGESTWAGVGAGLAGSAV